MNLRYFLAGMLAFALCGFGIPGPQGAASGGGSFDGDLAGNTLTDGTAGFVTVDVPLLLQDAQSMILGTGSDARLVWDTGQTNDSPVLYLDGTGGSEALILADYDVNGSADLGFADQTNPTLVFTSATSWASDATEYMSVEVATGGSAIFNLGHVGHTYIFRTAGSNRLTMSATAIQPTVPIYMPDDAIVRYGSGGDVFAQGELTAIADNTASTVFSVSTGNGDMAGITLTYTIQATDATEYQAEHGTVRIALVDDAGGVVGSIAEDGDTQQALSSGTLTSTWSLVTTDDGSIEVQVTADTSLTPSTFQVRWHVIATGDVSLVVP